jgi:hypothetical protein
MIEDPVQRLLMDQFCVKIGQLQDAMRADDERLRAASVKAGVVYGCDTPDAMADEVLRLRARNRMLGKVRESVGAWMECTKCNITCPCQDAVIDAMEAFDV